MSGSRDRFGGSFQRAIGIFREQGGMLRTSEALRVGIHPRTLYGLRDAGIIERLSRGLYRLVETPPLGNPDLITVALKVPKGVICLVSALAFHNLTIQVPHKVYLALPRESRKPRLRYPPLQVFEFGSEVFPAGIEVHELDGVSVRVYSPEKTLADCFKYRNKLGLDVAIEALKLYAERRNVKVGEITRYAQICRVAKVMRPYLEVVF